MKDFWRSTQSSIIRRFSTLRLVYVFYFVSSSSFVLSACVESSILFSTICCTNAKNVERAFCESKTRGTTRRTRHMRSTLCHNRRKTHTPQHTSQGTHATSWRAHFFCFGRVKDFDRVQFRWTRRGGLITKWAQPPTVRGIALQNTAMPHGDVWPLVGIGNSLLWGYPIKCWPYNKW